MLQLPFYLVNYVNKHKYVTLFKPFASYFFNFANKTLTLQQYNPNNTAESFHTYDVRDVIDDNAGVITLARLDGTYASQVPYAWFS